MSDLRGLKEFIEKEYMRSVLEDLDAAEISPDEKVVIFADMCDKAGIDLRARLLGE